jgi:hypothetical protein
MQRKDNSYIAELANELPAHAARASRRRDVGGDGDGTEIASFGSLFEVTSSVAVLPQKYLKIHGKDNSLTCWVTAVAIATRSAQVPTG